MGERISSTSDGRAKRIGVVGEWLVIPGPVNQHLWRWGRITGLVSGDGPLRYRIRWTGADQDSVVLPPPDSRFESSTVWPTPAGDAIGTWPDGPAGGTGRPMSNPTGTRARPLNRLHRPHDPCAHQEKS